MQSGIISSTLIYKIRQPVESTDAIHPALILLHGRDRNEDDLLRLADHFDPGLFIVSVRAPYKFEEKSRGYAWYDVARPFSPDPQQFIESYHRLTQFIMDAIEHYPIDPSRVFLFGFSMGCVMSFALGLTKPEMIRGIVAHSGYIPEIKGLKPEMNRLDSFSIFVAHGIDDPMIPIQHGRRSRDLLSATNADLTYREYPSSHKISRQSLHDISEWLELKCEV